MLIVICWLVHWTEVLLFYMLYLSLNEENDEMCLPWQCAHRNKKHRNHLPRPPCTSITVSSNIPTSFTARGGPLLLQSGTNLVPWSYRRNMAKGTPQMSKNDARKGQNAPSHTVSTRYDHWDASVAHTTTTLQLATSSMSKTRSIRKLAISDRTNHCFLDQSSLYQWRKWPRLWIDNGKYALQCQERQASAIIVSETSIIAEKCDHDLCH